MNLDTIGILADDLTGADDTGAQFSRLGARVLVLVSLDRIPAALPGQWDAVVLNTGSRNLPPSEARSRVAASFAHLQRWRIPLVYKKIDSTLRGPWLPELKELLDLGVRSVYVAPAFPLNGRTVEGGVVKVTGVPVHETEAARDGLSPVRGGHLPSLLESELGIPVEAWSRQFGLRLAANKGSRPAGAGDCLRVVVCDAREQADLASLAAEIFLDLPGPLLVGSAGFARELAACLLNGRTRGNSAVRRRAESVLVVSGSRSDVTKRQVERLRQSGEIAEAEIAPEQVDGAWNAQRAVDLATGAITQISRHRMQTAAGTNDGSTYLVTLGSGGPGKTLPEFQRRSERLNQMLGLIVSQWLSLRPNSALVLTGGDVAAATIEALGGEGIEMGNEIMPGIPMGWLVGGAHSGLPIVTKAGAFGAEDALVQSARFVHFPRGPSSASNRNRNSLSGQQLS